MKHLYTRTCEICGKEFQSFSSKKRVCYDDHYRKCPYCGKDVLWNSYREFHGCKPCIHKESSRKRKITMQEKYGGPTTFQSKELIEKIKVTNLKRYGVENPLQSEEIRTRFWRENYGVENPMQVPEIAKKSADTRMEKIDQILEHTKQTGLKQYGVDNVFRSPEIRRKYEQTSIERYGFPYYVLTDEYRNSVHSRVSKTNKDFGEHLENKGIYFVQEYSIGGESFDFFVPDKKLLIEINPSYTHSIVGTHCRKEGLPKYYHVDKTNVGKELGFQCLHVWDWDNWDKLIEVYFPQFTIDGNNCKVYKLTWESCKLFLEENDTLPVPRGQFLCLGLVTDNEIVQVMILGKAKYQDKYSYQIYRVCTKRNYCVDHGWDLLSSAASQVVGVTSCIAYANVSKPLFESIYTSIGMHLQKRNQPNLIWSKGSDYLWDYIISLEDSSRYTHLIEDGWIPVYDCGTDVYVFE